MRFGRILPLGLLLLAFAPAPAQGVADDAFLSILSLSAWTGGDPPDTGELQVQLGRTDDAPDGPITGWVEFLVQGLDGAHPDQRINASYTFDVGSTDPVHGGTWHDVQAEWIPGPGLYNVTATLWAEGAEGAWDSHWVWAAVGRSERLGTGWGRVQFPPASSFDVDGDGQLDVWLADAATGEALARPLDAAESIRMGSLVPRWSPQCGRSLMLDLGGMDAPPTRIRIATSLVEALVPGDPGLQMHTQSRGGPAPQPADGAYEAALGIDYYGSRSDHALFLRGCEQPERQPHVWQDGFRTTANVTHWDLDEDGAMDMRFWPTDAGTVEEARNETKEQRRTEEVVLVADVRVEHRTTRRVLTFDLSRPGGGHEGAWVEIQDAPRMFRELLGAPDNASVSYRLSLPANESLVELDGNTTWAWIGHFSTQTLTVILDEAAAGDAGSDDESTTGEGSESISSSSSSRSAPVPGDRSPIAGPGALAAMAMVALAAALRSRLGR